MPQRLRWCCCAELLEQKLAQLLQTPIDAAWWPAQLTRQLTLTAALNHDTAQQDLIVWVLLRQPLLHFSFSQHCFWGWTLIGWFKSHPVGASIQ